MTKQTLTTKLRTGHTFGFEAEVEPDGDGFRAVANLGGLLAFGRQSPPVFAATEDQACQALEEFIGQAVGDAVVAQRTADASQN